MCAALGRVARPVLGRRSPLRRHHTQHRAHQIWRSIRLHVTSLSVSRVASMRLGDTFSSPHTSSLLILVLHRDIFCRAVASNRAGSRGTRHLLRLSSYRTTRPVHGGKILPCLRKMAPYRCRAEPCALLLRRLNACSLTFRKNPFKENNICLW